MMYDIGKEKGSNRYYVCLVGSPKPISGPYPTKKKALRIAADYNDMNYKEFIKIRRKEKRNDKD